MTLARREFLKTVAVASAAGAMPFDDLWASSNQEKSSALVDVNVSLGRWPFRRLPLDDTSALVAKLKSHDVKKAWACSFDALFHKNMGVVNANLVADCSKNGRGI